MSNPFKKNDEKVEDNTDIEIENPTEDNQNNEEIKVEVGVDLQAKYDELNNQYIRLAADFDNYRKRQAQERENLLKYGAEETLKKLIEVLDNFDRAQKAIENIEDSTQIKDSFNLVCNQLRETLKKTGLETIETEGQEFNPNFHEAVMQTPTSEHAEGTIITELQKGYKIGDKVLRASLVNVATAE